MQIKSKVFNSLTTILIVFSLYISAAQAAKYTMVIEPTYPIEQGKQVYEPLRKWLSKKTGHNIEIIIDKNYFSYWRNSIGKRTPDFSFDAPHIAAYRINRKDYRPIATTLEPSTFHLISLDIPYDDETVDQFMVGKKVIMIPNPSLASVFFNRWFTDLFASPSKIVTALSWQDAVELVFDGAADAAIVPEWMLNLYPNFESLKKSDSLPGPTFLASPNVPKDVAEAFQAALISLVDDEEAYDVLVELNTQGFQTPKTEEYTPLLELLPGGV
jgi:ABC-type phosphate/phosphonate transport system substrate-binding protein